MPKLGTRERAIEAGLSIAEYGLEYVTYEAIAKKIGVTNSAVRKTFHLGGYTELKAEIIKRATETVNPYVLGQMWARRPLR